MNKVSLERAPSVVAQFTYGVDDISTRLREWFKSRRSEQGVIVRILFLGLSLYCSFASATEILVSAPIQQIGLSQFSVNRLTRAGIENLGELILMTEAEILDLPLVGRKTLNEINELLTAEGLRVGSSPFPELTPENRILLKRKGIENIEQFIADEDKILQSLNLGGTEQNQLMLLKRRIQRTDGTSARQQADQILSEVKRGLSNLRLLVLRHGQDTISIEATQNLKELCEALLKR